MGDKRQFVLYGIVAIAMLGVLLTVLYLRVSDREESDPISVSTIATTSDVASAAEADKPAVARLPFKFEVVTDQTLQAKGLSGRADVPSDYGMLFVFQEKDRHGFWMKDMLVSIDIIWISDTGVVVGIEEAVSPATYPSVLYPPEPVRYVLETRAGEARRLSITVGTKLNLPLPYGQTVSE